MAAQGFLNWVENTRKYYMEGHSTEVRDLNYDQRFGLLHERIRNELQQHLDSRRDSLELVRCIFKHTAKRFCSRKCRHEESMEVAAFYELDRTTLSYSKSGDMKADPWFQGNRIVWTSGTESGGVETWVSIQARYTSAYVQEMLEQERAKIVQAMIDRGLGNLE